jgi:hypothetical protein
MDLFCLSCAGLVIPLIEDDLAKQAFAWLEEQPGERYRPEAGCHVRDHFPGLARALYDAHDRREGGLSGRAVHIAFDFWADWYEYAFPNVDLLFQHHPTALREAPRPYLSAIVRDIFGNPFRPVAVDRAWLTPTVTSLAQAIYDDRAFDRLPILADALEDAGCTDHDILAHCRGGGEHVRGCRVVDLLLGKE